MKLLLPVIGLIFTISGLRAEAVPLTPANPRFTYYAAFDGEDARAVLVNLSYSDKLKCYVNEGQQGSLTYTFEVSAGASGVRIQTNGFATNDGRSGIEGTYSVDGGPAKKLFNTGRSIEDGTEIKPTGIPNFENVTPTRFISDGTIELDPLKKHTVVLTIASNGYGDWNEQILRGAGQELFDEGGNPQSLIVTALFKKPAKSK